MGNPVKRIVRAAMQLFVAWAIPQISRTNPVFRENPYLPRTLPETIALNRANRCLRVF